MKKVILSLAMCAFTFTYTFAQCGSFSLSVDSFMNIKCNGDSTGAIYTTTTGGTPPYVYAWSSMDSTEDVMNLPAGTYSVTVVDTVNMCVDSATQTLTEPPALSIAVDSIDSVYCNGDSTGAVYTTVTGGVTPYTYMWNNGDTTQDISSVPAGTYMVTVTDSNGCMDTAQKVINEPPALSITVDNVTDVTCANDANGSVSISVNGGVSPYSYNWSNGATSQDISGLPGNNYTVTVTDDNGCTVMQTVTVNEPAPLTSSINKTDVRLCMGTSSGSIDLQVSGGTTPYNYNWSTGDNTQDLNNLEAGMYTVVIRDDNNCTQRDTAQILELSTGFQVDTLIGSKVVSRGETVLYSVAAHPGSSYDFSVTGGTKTDSIPNDEEITVQWNNILGNGQIKVVETDSLGCKDTATFWINVVAGIADQQLANRFSVYPNPVDDQLQINYEGNTTNDYNVLLVNTAGKTVRKASITSGQHSLFINMNSLAKGIYFIHIQEKGTRKTAVKRVVKGK